VNGPDISKYGVVIPSKTNSDILGIVEKPTFDNAPSNLASIGRYILTPEIFSILSELNEGINGEIQLADALNVLAASGKWGSVPFKGKRSNCGEIDGFINANNHAYSLIKSYTVSQD